MASDNKTVTYELLILSNGKWLVHNVYDSTDFDVAMADTRTMQGISTVQGVRLLKEIYDENTNASQHVTMFEESKASVEPEPEPEPKPEAKPEAKPTPPKPETGKAGPLPRKAKKAGDSVPKVSSQGPVEALGEKKPEEPAPPQAITSVLPKFVIFEQSLYSLLISILAVFVVSWVASFMLTDAKHFPVFSRREIHAIIFISLFALFSLVMALRIAWRNLVAKYLRDAQTAIDDAKTLKESQHDLRLSLPPEAIEDMQPAISLDELLKEGDEDKDEDDKTEDVANPEDGSLDELAKDLPQLPPEVKSAIKKIKLFISQFLKALKGGMADADPYATFGVSLYTTGAAQALIQENNIEKEYRNEILYESLSQIELTEDRINHFIDRADDYLISDPRYIQMYQVGRAAMGIWLESGRGSEDAFALSYENWIKPRPKPTAAPPVVVLFTDIAGSTAMTLERGDEAAQVVVREHNRIVREAIAIHHGREIKHTGDGIMASFTSGVNGVEAAIDMQKGASKLVAENSDEPMLKLKIGINVGEPISEENDLFGVTVQLAARIVDKAQSGEILISEAIHGLMSGKKIPLEKHEDFEMKGFEDPVTTYRVMWTELEVEKPNSDDIISQ